MPDDEPYDDSTGFRLPEAVRAAADEGYDRVGMSRVLHEATIVDGGTLLLVTSERENKYPFLVPTEVSD